MYQEQPKTSNPQKENKDNEDFIIEKRICGSETVDVVYSKNNYLGKGGFAVCYQVTELKSKRVSAAKIISKSSILKDTHKQKLLSEIKIHRKLDHNHVVKFEHVFEDNENVYILLELCNNGTLHDLIKRRKRLSEPEVKHFTLQLIDGLKYLHSNNVVHRDLKLGNLFLNNKMEIKLADFGLSARIDEKNQIRRTVCGTPNYIAPEILKKDGHSYQVDIWSLGVVIYTLLFGNPPFETDDVKKTYKKILANNYTFPKNHVEVSELAKEFLSKLLQSDPLKRLTLDQMSEHPYLSADSNIPNYLGTSILAVPHSMKRINNSSYVSTMNLGSIKTKVITHQFSEKKTPTFNENQNTISSSKAIEFMKTNTVPFHGIQLSSETTQQKKEEEAKVKINPEEPTVEKKANHLNIEYYVIDSLDYTSKYGLAYYLSNGTIGFCFNDSTKMILLKNKTLNYISDEKGKKEVLKSYDIESVPEPLQKKFKLIMLFKSKFDENISKKPILEDENGDSLIYVKKYLQTKHAMMYRLSNKIIQLDFEDGSKLILSSFSRQVTFMDKNQDKKCYPLDEAMSSEDNQMIKRLKYCKKLLEYIRENSNE